MASGGGGGGSQNSDLSTTATLEAPPSSRYESSRLSVASTDSRRSTASSAVVRESHTADEFGSSFQRFGSLALRGLAGTTEATKVMAGFLDFGFTGETYADFDKPLRMNVSDPLCILHFNDVYNVEQATDGSGGISRFVNALRRYAPDNPLILFSGDAFNPSTLSTQTKGRHMIPFLNMLKIHTACLGNHDFDFGVDQLEYLTGSTQFPWLLSNVFDADAPDSPLARGIPYRIFEWQGHRVGIMGLVEKEWLATLPSVSMEDVIYVDFVTKANELSKFFRSKEVDLIIALTHMRAPNDERLALESEDVDLVLGGHDHEYYGARMINGTFVVKSGTDFREFSRLVIHPGSKKSPKGTLVISEPDVPCFSKEDRNSPNWPPATTSFLQPETDVGTKRPEGVYIMPKFAGGSAVRWKRRDVNPESVKSNRHVDAIVAGYVESQAKQMEKIIGETSVDLETRFAIVRTSECNVGNWLADLMRIANKSDVAILNSGTIRSDKIFHPGVLRLADLFAMLPMRDPLLVLAVTGDAILDILENSVSQYPKLEGRFLQISGMRFRFDPSKPAGQRVIHPVHITRDDDLEEVQKDRTYTLCTKEYLAVHGKDGYDVLKGCKILRDSEGCQDLLTVARNAFSMAAMANGFRKPHTLQTARQLDKFKSRDAKKFMLRRLPTLCRPDSPLPPYACDLSDADGDEEAPKRYQLTCYVDGRIQMVDSSEVNG